MVRKLLDCFPNTWNTQYESSVHIGSGKYVDAFYFKYKDNAEQFVKERTTVDINRVMEALKKFQMKQDDGKFQLINIDIFKKYLNIK